jgi:type I restriction enzyme S subunit
MMTKLSVGDDSSKLQLPNDWSEIKIQKLLDKGLLIDHLDGNHGELYPSAEEFSDEGVPYVSANNFSNGVVDLDGCKKLPEDRAKQFKKGIARNDDVIFAHNATVGPVALLKTDLDYVILGTTATYYRCNNDRLLNHYLLYAMQSNFFVKQYSKVMFQSTRSQVPITAQRKLALLIPSYPEQKAIAQVLSTADAAIHTTEKLIAQKELRKKWLMQQLLAGKKRLKGFENTKWKIQPLENFIKPIVREVPKPSTPYLGIGLRSHGKGTFLKYDEQPEKNSMDNFYVVRPNDLIVNITFAWEQAIAIVRPEDDGALASHRFPTYSFIEDKGHPDFFRFYILQPRMKFMLQMISPGGAGRNRVMSKSDFIKLEFLLPDYKEQTAISQVLQAAEKEISLLKTKAEKLRVQKKGLMQQLLTGKVRLKI